MSDELAQRLKQASRAAFAKLTAQHVKLSGWHPIGDPENIAGAIWRFHGDANQTATYRQDGVTGKLTRLEREPEGALLEELQAFEESRVALLGQQMRHLVVLRRAAARLWSGGYTMRGAGGALGLTGQRVHQLVGSIAEAHRIAAEPV
jgi:hypothetical protein